MTFLDSGASYCLLFLIFSSENFTNIISNKFDFYFVSLLEKFQSTSLVHQVQ